MKAKKLYPSVRVCFSKQGGKSSRLSKSEFNHLLHEFVGECVGQALAIRRGVEIHSLYVENLYNLKDFKKCWRCPADIAKVEQGDILLFRGITAEDLSREISGVFIITDKKVSESPFPVYADYEPINGRLYIINADGGFIRKYPPEVILGIALSSVKVAPLFDMKP